MIQHCFYRLFVPLLLLFLCLTSPASADLQFPLKAKRILFLGDSITHAGRYVAWIETQLRLQGAWPLPEMFNIGLSSETCSGLSEPDHPFARPDIHERLDRALAKLKPDVVVACYGMNDGIYHPFSEERFAAYRNGVNRLIKKVHAAGAKLVLMTPPPFDPVPLRGKGKLKPAGEKKYAYFAIYENYDDVLARYGKWVMQQKDRVEMVIDLHTPMAQYVAEKRKKDSQFTLSPDGIHPNADGHRLLGETILRAWGIESTTEPDAALLKLMTQRMSLLRDGAGMPASEMRRVKLRDARRGGIFGQGSLLAVTDSRKHEPRGSWQMDLGRRPGNTTAADPCTVSGRPAWRVCACDNCMV